MKKLFLTAILFSAVLVPALQPLYASGESLNGFVSDTMCGKKHMMPGASDAKCIEECIRAGAKYALVVGDKVYTLAGDKQVISPFAGKRVHVEGEVRNDTITVRAIHAE